MMPSPSAPAPASAVPAQARALFRGEEACACARHPTPAEPVLRGAGGFPRGDVEMREAAEALRRPPLPQWWFFNQRGGTDFDWSDREPSVPDIIYWADRGWDLQA